MTDVFIIIILCCFNNIIVTCIRFLVINYYFRCQGDRPPVFLAKMLEKKRMTKEKDCSCLSLKVWSGSAVWTWPSSLLEMQKLRLQPRPMVQEALLQDTIGSTFVTY